jgi:probable phosphoglycerate mutase
MGRCVETGAAIAKACGITAAICGDLNDIDYGAWQFRTFKQAQKDDPALFAAWFATPQFVRFPQGESLQDVAARAANVLRFIRACHPDDTIVLVGHDSINRVLLLQWLDLSLSAYWRLAQEPCCINEADIAGDKICILRLNETQHLDSISTP